MSKEMLINVSEGEECRIALVENGRLEELYMERTSNTSHVGNIYKGRVTNVEPSIQAAFIDFGLGRNGFLHISDLMPTYFGRDGSDYQETVGRKMARRDRPPIQRCLRRGDEIIVQIIKEGIGTKGPTLTSYISIPGRMLVMMPGMGKMGVSKKIEDEEERRRLRKILDGLKPPKGVAFIIRTAGIGKTKAEIERDLKYLTRLWETIEKKQKEPGPVELYTEGDLVTRTVRDVFTSDVDKIVIDSKEVAKRVKEVIKITAPRTKNRVDVYDEQVPLFHKYGIEKDIELMYSRHVPLPSGGSLVIDSTEAIVAIDVNSGKFREHADAETTAFRTDMEAADEICRQLKLRDLGGVIICDFIDLRFDRHRRELEKRLDDNFRRDRAKTKVLRMSQFGIIEMTRQRMRPSLKRSVYFDCPHCKGAGLVKTPESMALDVMRRLAIATSDLKVARVELAVCPDVAFYLLNKKRKSLTALEEESGKRVLIKSDPSLGLDEVRFSLFDSRDGAVVLEELGMTLPHVGHTTQLGTRGGRNNQRNRGRDRGRDQQRPLQSRPPQVEDEEDDDARFARETAEEAQAAEDGPSRKRAPVEDESDEPDSEESDSTEIESRDTGSEDTGSEDADSDESGSDESQSGESDVPEFEGESSGDRGDAQGAPRGGGRGEQGRDDQQGEGGPRRRRRRRRGRRGRGAEGEAGQVNGGPTGPSSASPGNVNKPGPNAARPNNGGQGQGSRDRDNVASYDRGRRPDGSFENVTELETVDFGDDEPQPVDPRQLPQQNRNDRGGPRGGGGGRRDGRGGFGRDNRRGGRNQPPPIPKKRVEVPDDLHEVGDFNGNVIPGAPVHGGRPAGGSRPAGGGRPANAPRPTNPAKPVNGGIPAGGGGGAPLELGEDGQPRKRRRRRGGRRHRRRRENQAAREAEARAAAGLLPLSPNDSNDVLPEDADESPEFENAGGVEELDIEETDDVIKAGVSLAGVDDESEDAEETEVEGEVEVEPTAEEPVEEEPAAKPARKSRSRGGRGRSSSRKPTPPPAEPLPVVKTGSTDKHLVASTEDIEADAVEEDVTEVEAPIPTRRRSSRRPSSYGDLDAIPDDYD